MARERTDMASPLLGSVLLHGSLALAVLVSWPWLGRHVTVAPAVPVTIVARGPVTSIRPAEQAPKEAVAQTEAPEPEAPPEAEPPPPPAKAKAQPAPAPKPAPKKPAAKEEPALDLEALAKSLKPSRRSSAQKGASRPETSAEARSAVGEANNLVGSFLNTLSADLSRRWNPNCEVEGGRDVNIEVAFRLDSGGRVVGSVDASGERSANAVVRVASDRAKRAVLEAQPFQNLPSQLYDERIVVRFDARTACASG